VSKYDTQSILNVVGKQNQKPSEISYIQTLTVPVFNSLLENCTVIAQLPSKYVDGSESLRGAGNVHVGGGEVSGVGDGGGCRGDGYRYKENG